MPYKDKEISKLYYSIGEVAALLNVNPSLIRFWEKSFDLTPPKKNKKGNRLFIQSEIDHLRLIHQLVKQKGYTLAGAKEYLSQQPVSAKEKIQLVDTLERLKEFLLEWRDRL